MSLKSLSTQYISSSPASQRGVALITIMLVVAIATVIAAELVSRVHFHIQRASHQHTQAQAYQFALGGEELARQVLHLDNEKTDYDHLNESWSKLNPQYEFDQGVLIIKIQDLHSRLNVNNLISSEGKPDEIVLEQFHQLFSQLSIDMALLNTLIDWLDPDTTPIALNSEDNGYLTLDKPYRTANARLVHLSELTLLQGWDHPTVAKLAPFITALPSVTKINVNTAPPQVLATLAKGFSILAAEDLAASRDPEGFDNMDAFLTHQSLAGLKIKINQATVNSEYFAIYIESRFAGRTTKLQTRVHRNASDGKIQLISRDRSSQYLWPQSNADAKSG